MAKVTIEGVHPALDGEHDLDVSRFTNRELHIIKVETGISGLELEQAVEDRDPDSVVALAWVALSRKGIAPPTWDPLWDADVGNLRVSFKDEEERAEKEEKEELPPTSAATSRESESGGPAAAEGTSESGGSSGESLKPDSESQEQTPLGTGPQDSDTGAGSAPPTLET